MLTGLVASLRPRQWVKNLFLFAGLVFGQKLFTPARVDGGGGVPDLLRPVRRRLPAQRRRRSRADRLHPDKRHRPGGGRTPLGAGGGDRGDRAHRRGAGGERLAVAGGSPWRPSAYVVLLSAYSAWLKHLVIVDVLVVAIGFVLRAVAGALAVQVAISGWLLICTILLALFLALGKRRHEVLTLEAEAARHRAILAEYSAALLDQMIAVVTASTVTAYALYTMSPETVAKFHTALLPATLPFVLYGVFRYLYLLYQRQLGGNPSDAVLHDRALLLNTLLWMVAVLLIIYGT